MLTLSQAQQLMDHAAKLEAIAFSQSRPDDLEFTLIDVGNALTSMAQQMEHDTADRLAGAQLDHDLIAFA